MLAVMLLTIFLLLISYLLTRWMQLKQYWAKRGVPYIPPNPVFGSLSFLRRENPGPWFRRMYEQFKEPYVGVWIFWRPGLLINSEKLARNIFNGDQANFKNRLAHSGTSDPVGGLNLFSLRDPLWSAVRKRLSALFTTFKLKGTQTHIKIKCKELIKRIDKDRRNSDPINLKTMATDFTTDIISTSTFGMASEATLTGESYMRIITGGLSEFSFIRAVSWLCIFFIPEFVDLFRMSKQLPKVYEVKKYICITYLWKWAGVPYIATEDPGLAVELLEVAVLKMFPKESTEYLRNVLRTMIAQRGGLENIITEPRDLLDVFIKMKQENNKELDMTEDMMLAQAAALVLGGFETTAITITLCIYELAFHPEVQDKLYQELQEAKDEHGDDIFDAGVLSQLTYLNCVVNESLRKYPLLTWLDRIALEDYKVDEHLTIKAGTPVLVNVIGLHYDPYFHPDPEKFNPERFMRENKSGDKPFPFYPFGSGPRSCVGQRLGYSIVHHGITAIILNYKLRPLPNAPKPSEIKLNVNTVFTFPEDKLSVEFVSRN